MAGQTKLPEESSASSPHRGNFPDNLKKPDIYPAIGLPALFVPRNRLSPERHDCDAAGICERRGPRLESRGVPSGRPRCIAIRDPAGNPRLLLLSLGVALPPIPATCDASHHGRQPGQAAAGRQAAEAVSRNQVRDPVSSRRRPPVDCITKLTVSPRPGPIRTS